MAAESHKFVYAFGGGSAEGRADMKALLGGKGANLAEMANLGLPVPPGFTITTEVCTVFYGNRRHLPGRPRRPRSTRRWPPSGTSGRASVSAMPPIRCWCRSAPARAPRCPA